MKGKKTEIILGVFVILFMIICSGMFFFITKIFIKENLTTTRMSDEEIEVKYQQLYNLGYDASNVEITSRDAITLSGTKIFANDVTDNWVIVAHGFNADRTEPILEIAKFLELGYNVLTIDQRGYGLSGGKYSTLGAWEQEDIRLWIDYIIEQKAESKIVLYGQSMGASSILMSLGTDNFPQNVVAAIEDSGYTSIYDILHRTSNDIYGNNSKLILSLSFSYIKFKLHCDLAKASAFEAVKQTKIPILFIHGATDTTVPVDMGRALFNAANGEKELWIVEGANHLQADDMDTQAYYQKLQEFLEKYVK